MNKYLPAHILSLYVWELLQQETGMQKVNGYVPIVPIQETPQLESDKPYIIYAYSESPGNRSFQQKAGTFALRFVVPKPADGASQITPLNRMVNTVAQAFQDFDIATEAVNFWSSNFGTGEFVGIRFTHLETSYVEQAEPAETEGGPIDGIVNIAYKCIINTPTPVVNSVPTGLWTP